MLRMSSMVTSMELVLFHPVLADRLILSAQRNILIDEEGAPRLCDFGQSKLIGIAGFTATKFAGAARYLAPELLPTASEEQVKLTRETDVYAFSMVALEVCDSGSICSFRSSARNCAILFALL